MDGSYWVLHRKEHKAAHVQASRMPDPGAAPYGSSFYDSNTQKCTSCARKQSPTPRLQRWTFCQRSGTRQGLSTKAEKSRRNSCARVVLKSTFLLLRFYCPL